MKNTKNLFKNIAHHLGYDNVEIKHFKSKSLRGICLKSSKKDPCLLGFIASSEMHHMAEIDCPCQELYCPPHWSDNRFLGCLADNCLNNFMRFICIPANDGMWHKIHVGSNETIDTISIQIDMLCI